MSDKLFTRVDEDDVSLISPFIDIKELERVRQVKVPSTAQEYLVSVIAERQNIEEITQCQVDYKVYRNNQSLFFDQEPLPQVADNLKPTKEWQNIQVADFSEVRSYISRMRKNIKEINKVKKLDFKNADLLWWRDFFNKHDPDLSLVLGFTSAQLEKVLEQLLKLMKLTNRGDTIEEYIGRWVFASLSCLGTPLHSDVVSIIRNLAKQCWTVRSHIDPDNENAKELAAPLTLIICFVGHYFRQLDLADSL